MESATRLDKLGYHELANRIKNGEFDETADEGDKAYMSQIIDNDKGMNSAQKEKLKEVVGLKKQKKKSKGPFPNLNKYKSKEAVPMPRIRGNAVQNKNGSWGWEAMITIGDHPDPIYIDSGKSEFLNKESAKEDLTKHVFKMSDIMAREVYKSEPTGYLDLINNKFIPK